MAAKTFFRSMVGASMPMWIPPVYAAIGHWWAGSIFAFLSVAMAPSKSSQLFGSRSKGSGAELTLRLALSTVPFIFFFYGGKIRQRSKMAS